MGKLDELRRQAGGNIDDSMGVNRAATPGDRPPAVAPSPERFRGITKSRAAAEIPTEKIAPDPDQPRTEFDAESIARLAESLRTRGQLQPIRVRWDEGGGRYVIICGERRWRAAREGGLATMTCIVHDGPMGPGEKIAVQLVENALREDLKPVEQARAFRALMDLHGWSARHVARELAYPQSSLVKILELLDLPPAVQERVERGELAVTTAYELRRIADPADQVAVADRIAADGLTRDEAERIVRGKAPRAPGRGRGARAKAKPRETSAVYRTSSCKVTVESRKGVDGDVARAALAEVLARLEGRGEAA